MDETVMHYLGAMPMLVRTGIITIDPEEAAECCGLERDADGFCRHRPGHPIYIGPPAKGAWE